ncbi:MAG: hypothetical protein M1820_010262 [Bogoriella megaspora]|nr:MAG: hypothetical protein M1820_010262 [Bogoriella megaspora]
MGSVSRSLRRALHPDAVRKVFSSPSLREHFHHDSKYLASGSTKSPSVVPSSNPLSPSREHFANPILPINVTGTDEDTEPLLQPMIHISPTPILTRKSNGKAILKSPSVPNFSRKLEQTPAAKSVRFEDLPPPDFQGLSPIGGSLLCDSSSLAFPPPSKLHPKKKRSFFDFGSRGNDHSIASNPAATISAPILNTPPRVTTTPPTAADYIPIDFQRFNAYSPAFADPSCFKPLNSHPPNGPGFGEPGYRGPGHQLLGNNTNVKVKGSGAKGHKDGKVNHMFQKRDTRRDCMVLAGADLSERIVRRVVEERMRVRATGMLEDHWGVLVRAAMGLGMGSGW